MSREIGDELEDKISADLGINKTTNSGAKFDNGDLTDKKLIVEAKVKSKSSFSIPKGELSKLKKQADKHGKDWIYVQKNLSGTYVLMDYNTFLELTEAWFIKNGNKKEEK